MKQTNSGNDSLLHCRNCDGYYDPSLPNCPHCGEETANNLSAGEESTLSVADYGGGFGAPGSTISKVAALLAGVLGAVALISLVVLGARAFSNMDFSSGDTSAQAQEDPADTSVPADASAEADTSAQPEQEKTEEPEEQTVVSPDEIILSYYDITLPTSGETLALEVTVSPSDWEGEITFTTDNKSVATVTAAGLIENVGAGECNITVSAGETSAVCIVRCKGGSTAGEGGSASVTGTYSDGKLEGSEKAAQQQAEDEEKRQKQQEEEEQQKQQEEEQQKQQEEEEEQTEASSEIKLEYYDITLVHVGDGYTFSPSGGNGTYSWSSGNSSVASVTSGGTVTATGVGETTITCTSGDVSVQVIVRVSGQ